MRSGMQREKCLDCAYFRPHPYFPYVGLCILQQEARVASTVEACASFKRASLNELKEALREEGWLYCLDCNSVITDEGELEEHYNRYRIAVGVVIDEVFREEAYSAD